MILIIQHIQREGPGTLGDFFRNSDWKVHTVNLADDQSLPALVECEGIISLGGPMNVHETQKHPFLADEERFFREALQEKIPLLGICLGAQLLAKSCGASVAKAIQPEIGWFKVRCTEAAAQDPLFEGLSDSFDVFQWHEDTFAIPEAGVLLAKAKACENQAFRVGDCAWGLQYHPEMNLKMLKHWLKESSGINSEKILFGYFDRQGKYLQHAYRLYLNFAKVIAAKQNLAKTS